MSEDLINIIFEDEEIIALNKPSGILTIPGNNQERAKSLVGMLEDRLNRKIFVVHRLDRDTSGAVVFAKNAYCHKSLCLQFEKGSVNRLYFALVSGKCDFEEKIIDIPLSKSKARSKKPALAKKGLKAITKIRVKKYFENFTLLEVMPLTGKRHQIRLHLKAIGHPLAIDKLYSSCCPINIRDISSRLNSFDFQIKDMTLHAHLLSFFHPKTNERIEIKTVLPKEYEILLNYG